MLIKINNVPLDVDTFARDYMDVTSDITEAITQPLTVAWSFGENHLISYDVNPINLPQHIINVASDIIGWVF